MKPVATLLIIALLALSTYGCASIVRGGAQDIPITVAPGGARIFVNGEDKGATPTTLTLKRKNTYKIVIQKEGFKDLTINIDKEFKMGWAIVGNIFSWGIIGIIVDISKGSAYQLSPEEVRGEMEKADISVIENDDKDSFQLAIFLSPELE